MLHGMEGLPFIYGKMFGYLLCYAPLLSYYGQKTGASVARVSIYLFPKKWPKVVTVNACHHYTVSSLQLCFGPFCSRLNKTTAARTNMDPTSTCDNNKTGGTRQQPEAIQSQSMARGRHRDRETTIHCLIPKDRAIFCHKSNLAVGGGIS